MKLKRFTIRHIAVALPALTLLGLTACSSDDADPAPKKETKGIALTIPLSSTRSADDGFSLDEDQRKSLFIATYDNNGKLIETIVENGEINTSKFGYDAEFDKIDEIGSFGTVLTVVLPTKEYGDKDGIQFAAVYLPEMVSGDGNAIASFTAPETLSELYATVENAYTLSMPENSGVWEPVDNSEMNIPMAGILDISSAVEGYDPILWNKDNPMFLNNDPLQLERAMAKVVITEGEGVGYFSKVGFDTPHQGTIMPDMSVWPSFGHVTEATPVLSSETFEELNFTQIYEPAREDKDFVFYTFETTFDDADDSTRELIHIEWKNATSADHDPVAKDFKFKYYPQFDENGNDLNAGGQFGPDANCWKGILRNHEYHFIIGLPQEQTPTVKLKVNEWTEDRYSVRL